MRFRTCPFCEATCGLEVTLEGQDVASVRGDSEDVFSGGFLCPKGTGLKHLQEDPDRLRTPLVKQADGSFAEASWEQALKIIDERLSPILAEHGRDAVAVYLGNPTAHNLAALLYGQVWLRALGSKNVYSASSVDQMPKHVSAGLMFGGALSIPIPDIDRTDHLLILGANPLVSNGSLLTAPDMRGRLRAIRESGGKIVVIDPRRTRTAEAADEHHFIRPGGDAHLLLGIVHTLFEEGLAQPGAIREYLNGLEEVEALATDFAPEAVAGACGITAAEIRRMARELATAERAVVYGRIGTCTQEFGALASWLVDVVNALTGNLDREGGAMFITAAAGQRNSSGKPGSGRGFAIGRWKSRVRGLVEAIGELPVSVLAEEIDTPGEGQVRALVTSAGNPLRSTPNSERLGRAVEGLDFMLSIDIYLNETTRHADVILPAPSPLEKAHYDIALYPLAARNVANYSPAVLPSNGVPQEWETLARLTGIVSGQGPDIDIEALDEMVIATMIKREIGDPHSRIARRGEAEILEELEPRRGPERMLDLMLRAGPHGDAFGDNAGGLTLAVLEERPHGVDLGPLEPRIPEVLRTASGKIELAPEPLLADLPRLRESLSREQNGHMVLVGRRQLRSNNSWMHNLDPLVKGKDSCTAHMHPDDAARLGLADGDHATLRSRVGQIDAPVEVTDAVMPGVVSLPHGWGHAAAGTRMSVAAAHPGVNSNVLSDESVVEAVSGNAVLSGIPVQVAAAATAAE